ncbi:uncharacterized protein LOC129600082 [Paramacrobiotus metropolitanus]|uniref:uncharacterized protein LOC129600082 n=1 Tax=Paramacrobiotus metropolitanus TaxID=2943436 RepID=UPI002445C48B|nr:uncharacterized protein LOC129600082 [Paramacrobiotus metropolitanus]XP_055354451.1 uncharacterized protein LOC129600082 [Paramacrobiotus metropolitanus]
MNLATVTFVCSLVCCSINCQDPWGGSGVFPGFPGNGAGFPSSGGCNGFAGLLSTLLGGSRCCSGGCGGGSQVVYYPIPFPPGPDPPTPAPVTTTTAPVPSCTVSISPGPFSPWMCDQTINPAMITGCPASRVTFQVSGIPCAYTESGGAIRFSPLSGGCAVGSGFVYVGTLTATDIVTNVILSVGQIQINTASLSYCTATTAAMTTSTAATSTEIPPDCKVSYNLSTSPTSGASDFFLTDCQQQFTTPTYMNCPFSRYTYTLVNFPCADLHSDGALVVDVNNPGCIVYPYSYYGSMTIKDSDSGEQLGVYYIAMHMFGLAYCVTP